MKIAQLSTCWAKTPPSNGYGGTEWIVHYLAEQLVALGHDVTLFATGDSTTSAKLWSWFDAPTPNFEIHDELLHVVKACEHFREEGFDIIHNHTYSAGPAVLALSGLPSVSTFHLLPLINESFYVGLSDSHQFISISKRQQELVPQIRWVGNVYNAINVVDFTFQPQKDDYLLFLGRVAPWKGTDKAVQVARALGCRLKIAGPLHEPRRAWFEQEVAPYIDGTQIEYVGEVNFDEKVQLLMSASALLFPVKWEEPFGMVMVEAMACGTPVVAFNRGAVPEIIRHGEVGLIVDDVAGMVEAVNSIQSISPAACRAYVEDNFDIGLMARRYVEVYERILSSQ